MMAIETLYELNRRCFVIAEAGVNHNGSVSLAHELVAAAARSGADAVKFQTFNPQALVADGTPKAKYQKWDNVDEDQRSMLHRLVLPSEAYPALKQHAADAGLAFLSTPFDEESADFLDMIGMPAFKIASGELTNHSFLAHVAKKRRHMILSTGMSYLSEVETAVAVIQTVGPVPLTLLHCVSSYPALPAEANLRAMRTLTDQFGLPVGYSDHTLGSDVAIAAVALGASVLEKHFTLDRNMEGPDHATSLEPKLFSDMVAAVRTVESSLGDGLKVPRDSELELRNLVRKSLHLARPVSEGAIVTAADLRSCRPGTGMPPSSLSSIVGRRAKRDLPEGAMLADCDLE